MDTGSKRTSISVEQMNALLEFMQKHPKMARGMGRGGQKGKTAVLDNYMKTWNVCAKMLNAIKPGMVKDYKGWSRYWCDWKYRTKRHALEVKAAKDQNTTGSVPSLSALEERIISIIGEDYFEGVVIKTDPLSDDSNEDLNTNHNDDNEDNELTDVDTYKTRRKRRRQESLSKEASDLDDNSSNCPSDNKTRLRQGLVYDDDENEASQFLKIERAKLESTEKLREAVENIGCQLTKLTDALVQMKDALINKHNLY